MRRQKGAVEYLQSLQSKRSGLVFDERAIKMETLKSLQKPKGKQLTLLDSKPVFCRIICGDCREVMKDIEDVDLIITSPPYADARKDHYKGIQPNEFSEWFLSFHEPFFEKLKNEGSFVLNIKDRVVNGVRNHFVWKTIQSLEENGWQPIDDYIWHKPNPMPGYWPTRLRDGWEYCFHLAKTKRPYMNQDAVSVPIGKWAKPRLAKLTGKSAIRHDSENLSGFGRDLTKWVGKKRVLPSNVLSLTVVGKNRGHPAVFPIGLPAFFIKLLSPKDSVILDPFAGSGTTGLAALQLRRNSILIDNNREYCEVAYGFLKKEAGKNVVIQREGF